MRTGNNLTRQSERPCAVLSTFDDDFLALHKTHLPNSCTGYSLFGLFHFRGYEFYFY